MDYRLMIEENTKRRRAAVFNAITGEGSTGERFEFVVRDMSPGRLWLPVSMRACPMVREMETHGSIEAMLSANGLACDDARHEAVVRAFVRERIRHDFPFWAAAFVMIKNKGGGDDVHFRLNRPQRRLVEALEGMRLGGRPIRLILLKARQWGGSTAVQMYMAWLQLVQRTGLNSLVVAQVSAAADEVRDMFNRMLASYPAWLLGDDIGRVETERVGNADNVRRVGARNCKVKTGSAERPDSARGGDYSLVHCTEVGVWKKTDGKRPEDIVRSACSGVLLQPLTMIVYESTANGVGNFFHVEYEAAKRGQSQFVPLFVPWYEIEQYSDETADVEELARFLCAHTEDADSVDNRHESGRYLYYLWERGATLQAIAWYIGERKKYSDHGDMAAEYPSDDVEAFAFSGTRVFDRYQCEARRATCHEPLAVGELQAKGVSGDEAFVEMRFAADSQGHLWVWSFPDDEVFYADRYIVVVDIGGRSAGADWSVITVFDRLGQLEGDPVVVVAQWYGHTDMDRLAWIAAQVAAWYNEALLVIESNTIETHAGGDAPFLLSQIRESYYNLYARPQSEEDIRLGVPRRYGFHTNTQTKPLTIHYLQMAVREGLWVERDGRCIDELLSYEQKPNGAFGAIDGKHDDMLMTRAIAMYLCLKPGELPMPELLTATRKPHHRDTVGSTI